MCAIVVLFLFECIFLILNGNCRKCSLLYVSLLQAIRKLLWSIRGARKKRTEMIWREPEVEPICAYIDVFINVCDQCDS